MTVVLHYLSLTKCIVPRSHGNTCYIYRNTHYECDKESHMHIPDNYLSPSSCAVMGAAMIPVWTIAVKKVAGEISKAKMPLLGVGAAFSFLIMMFNVPLPGGTTGHAVGGVLIAILLGPWSATIAITIALLIQALLFGDGGVLAFGANCFNMAFILPFTGYFIYTFLKSKIRSAKGEYIAMAIGAYIGLNLAALCAAIEFGVQPLLFKTAAGVPLYSPYPLAISVPAMMIPHLLVAGFVEVLFTVAIYSFIKKVSPSVIYDGVAQRIKPVYALIVSLVCLSPLGLLAAGTAWGEWGADEIREVVMNGKALGFVPDGMQNGFTFNAPVPDYAFKGLPEIAGYILSALAGVAILLIIFKITSVMVKNKSAA
jgi:cobalt/nickel transport system permease protein